MSTRTLRLLLAAYAVISPAMACASPQDRRPDAEGYPCKGARALTVVQDAQGFVIREPSAPRVPDVPPPAASHLEIGTSVKFDPGIFKRGAKQTEAGDASCC